MEWWGVRSSQAGYGAIQRWSSEGKCCTQGQTAAQGAGAEGGKAESSQRASNATLRGLNLIL